MTKNWEREVVFEFFNQGLGLKEVSEKLGMSCNKVRYLRQTWLAKQRGFKSYWEYRNHWAIEKGFKSYTDYLNHWARERGFKNLTDYKNHLAREKGFKSY